MPPAEPFACRLFASVGRRLLTKELQIHLRNDSPLPLEGTLLEVGFEWGDLGNSQSVNHAVGPVEPGRQLLLWRDDDASPEVRMHLKLSLRQGGVEQQLWFEFPRLYLTRDLPEIPELGRRGYTAEPKLS